MHNQLLDQQAAERCICVEIKISKSNKPLFQSTYCSALAQYGVDTKRNIDVVNLDPAAEHFTYEPLVDIRELIQVQDTMEDEELHFGPNGMLQNVSELTILI